MEHKDKQPLQTIQYGEDVRHHDGLLVQVEEPERPGEPQQKDQDDCAPQPCPGSINKRQLITLAQFPPRGHRSRRCLKERE